LAGALPSAPPVFAYAQYLLRPRYYHRAGLRLITKEN